VYTSGRPVRHAATDSSPGVPTGTQGTLTRWLETQGDACRCEVRYSGDGGVYQVDAIATPRGMTQSLFVECKPYRDDMPGWLFDNRDDVNGWLDKMQIIRESVPGASLALVPWNADFNRPRQWFLNRDGHRWRLIDETTGARVPW
jgi:hypothetical protein